jgi:hypothetical protein
MALNAIDLSFRGEVLGAHLRVPVFPPGKVGHEKGDGAPVPISSRLQPPVQQRPVPHCGFWSESETARLWAGFLPQVNDVAR